MQPISRLFPEFLPTRTEGTGNALREAGAHFLSSSVVPTSRVLTAALHDGKVIGFDALTGKEQRRFLADWRTGEERTAKKATRA